jgi:hypothetical protein
MNFWLRLQRRGTESVRIEDRGLSSTAILHPPSSILDLPRFRLLFHHHHPHGRDLFFHLLVPGGRWECFHVGDEFESHPRNRLDILGMVGVVLQRFADFLDAVRQRAFRDQAVGPHGV